MNSDSKVTTKLNFDSKVDVYEGVEKYLRYLKENLE